MILERPMIEFLIKLLLVSRSKLKSRARLEAENIALRQRRAGLRDARPAARRSFSGRSIQLAVRFER
jgi:hypothetical protein